MCLFCFREILSTYVGVPYLSSNGLALVFLYLSLSFQEWIQRLLGRAAGVQDTPVAKEESATFQSSSILVDVGVGAKFEILAVKWGFPTKPQYANM